MTAAAGCGDKSNEPALDPGKNFDIKRLDGTVTVDPPDAGPSELTGTTRAPDGVGVDAVRGAAQVTAALPGGGRQSATLSAGRFSVRARRGGALTEIALRGETCDDAAGGRRVTRRLFGDGKGSFSTRGRFGAAIVRGTKWGVRDRCDGTLVVARSGTVIAQDFVTGRRVTLRAPKRYLARRR